MTNSWFTVIFFLPGLGSRSRMFLAPWSRSGLKKIQEPEPLLYRLLEDKKQSGNCTFVTLL